ncbi:MAG: hypothetical protein Q4Q04_00040 [Methanocorpusculum sp.]|nr:hypothetical protein [Methanocorpusculum sp.]
MAVQTKSRSGDKPAKKEINWIQVCVVGFCVLIVVMCVLSFSNFSAFFNDNGTTSQTTAAVPGNGVAVNYTMYIGNQTVFADMAGFVAGYETNQSVYRTIENVTYPYVIYASEVNQISSAVLGMTPGQSTTVTGSGADLKYTFTKEGVASMGLDFASLKVGDLLYLNEYYTDELNEEAIALRAGVITAKDDTGLTIQYGTDTIEVQMVGYLKQSTA